MSAPEQVALDVERLVLDMILRRKDRGIRNWTDAEVELLARLIVARIRGDVDGFHGQALGETVGVIVIERGRAAEAALGCES